MYFWLAKNIRCIRPSRTSLTSGAAGRDKWIATSASCRDTSAERIAQCRSTRTLGNDCWNSTRRGASQNVPKPSVTATRTSPESVWVTHLLARSRSNEAASMRSTAETTNEPSSVRRVPWTSRVNSVAPIWRSKSSIRLRTTLIERSSRSAADLKLPQRTTFAGLGISILTLILTVRAGTPRSPGFYGLRPAVVSALKGQPRDFDCKPSDLRKLIERSDCRPGGYAAGISGESAAAGDCEDRSRVGQLPEGSGSCPRYRAAGCIHAPAQRIGLFQPRNPLRPLDRGLRTLSQRDGIRTQQSVVLLLRALRRLDEPEPGRHRARGICRRIGLPVDLDRCVPPQSQGHLCVRCVGQSCTRGRAGGRNSPCRFDDIRTLWRGV